MNRNSRLKMGDPFARLVREGLLTETGTVGYEPTERAWDQAMDELLRCGFLDGKALHGELRAGKDTDAGLRIGAAAKRWMRRRGHLAGSGQHAIMFLIWCAAAELRKGK